MVINLEVKGEIQQVSRNIPIADAISMRKRTFLQRVTEFWFDPVPYVMA